ncbi:MAG TPA: DUF2891 family protein, partial [Flavitalea sp.]|nr:DUF2891 family protein [Flavitalea sp.]
YRLGQTVGSVEDLGTPAKLHPAFYGCTSWNSSVQGFLSLTRLLKKFPKMEKADSIRLLLAERLSADKIMGEVTYFKGKYSKPFQRTAGWNTLLQLSKEMHTWNDTLGKKLEKNLQPLTDLLVKNYLEFLPKVSYSSRGTASGFSVAYDYAVTSGSDSLVKLIASRSRDFYQKDVDYKMTFDPSEQDFATAGLQEIDIMRRVLPKDEFRSWLSKFLPGLANENFRLEPAKDTASDEADEKRKRRDSAAKKSGSNLKDSTKLSVEPEIHPDLKEERIPAMDRLNISRALCLLGIADDLPEYEHLRRIAYEHIIFSLPNAVSKEENKLQLFQMMP